MPRYFLLEGQQKDDYLKRKKFRDEHEKYSSKGFKEKGSPTKYDIERKDDGKIQSRRSRAQTEPEGFLYKATNTHHNDKSHALQNPRFGHKRYINDEKDSWTYEKNDNMSKEDKKDFKASKKKIGDARKYAEKVTKDIDNKFGRDSYEAQSAKDAARRHYRNTHKNESSGIFEDIDLV